MEDGDGLQLLAHLVLELVDELEHELREFAVVGCRAEEPFEAAGCEFR